MDLLTTNGSLRIKSINHSQPAPIFFGKSICGCNSSSVSSLKLINKYGGNLKALAGQNQTKKLKKRRKIEKETMDLNIPSSDDTLNDLKSLPVASRSNVIQSCVVTSGLIGAFGLVIRQVSHIASGEGWPVLDCDAAVTFSFESWYLKLIAGSVIVVSSCRFLLLKIWPDFAESSNAANQQVLTALQPLDYLVVAFLPGISEELLFRGALLPLLGINWMSVFAVAALFGVLHVGSGRNYSFAIWATFVGVLYGYTTLLSSSVTVPIASHALNNLIGGAFWLYSSPSSRQNEDKL